MLRESGRVVEVAEMFIFLSITGIDLGLSLENSLANYLILSLLISVMKSNVFVPTAQLSSLIARFSCSS